MSPNDRSPATEATRDPAAEALLQIVAAMLHELRPNAAVQPLRLDATIERDLGLDSLSRVELAMRIERAFGIRLPDRLALAARTLRDFRDAIARGQPDAGAIPLPPASALPLAPVSGTPDEATTLVEAFRWHLERHPEREHITLLDGDETVEVFSYARLWADASEVATGLAARGIGRGDAVALMLPTSGDFFRVFLGALLVGAVPVPMYPPLRWSEIGEHVRGRAAILANSLARLLVTVPEAMFVGRIVRAELPQLEAVVSIERLRGAGAASPVPAAAAAGDTAMLQYTSGSTGDPKGVVLCHANLLANIRAIGRGAAATSSDRFVSWLPLYHDMGLIGAWLATMYHAVPLVLMPPSSFLARPARWFRAIHRFRATISAGPNFAYEIAASKMRDEDLAGLDLSCWRLAFNGAEPVRAATLQRFADRFARYGFDRRALMPVYGLAESAVGLTFPPLGRGPLVERIDARALADGVATPARDTTVAAVEVVSCGRPLPGHEIRVVDDAGREVPARTEGRLEFRGPSATLGYHRNPEATARLFHGEWLDTGDVGYIAGGEVFLTSRAKDLIKRGGHNIHPYDLEAAVGDLPGIRKGCVAVFGTTDRASGTERVIVVAETNQTDAASRAALRERIMAFASIHLNGPADEVLLVPARTVLKTSSGKIRRAACRELYEKGLLEAPRRAVWLQLAGLVGRATLASLRRGAHALAQVAYGVYGWGLLAALVVISLPLLFVLPRPQWRLRLGRLAARALLRGLGLRVAVEGLPHLASAKTAVLVANHSSYLDAVVLFAALPIDVHFAAKREFARMPFFGLVLRRLGAYFVERVDAARGIEDTRELEAAVARGETVAMFPEGTFSRAPGLAAFHLGAFVVSAENGAPVVPVVLSGTRSVLRAHRWLPVRYPVSVAVLAAILPEGRDWSAAVRLRERVREAMLHQCGEPDLAR
jgi:acyl carrier protein